MPQEKVICHTPTPGKKPTRIDCWKYEAVRRVAGRGLFGDAHTDGVVALSAMPSELLRGHEVLPGRPITTKMW